MSNRRETPIQLRDRLRAERQQADQDRLIRHEYHEQRRRDEAAELFETRRRNIDEIETQQRNFRNQPFNYGINIQMADLEGQRAILNRLQGDVRPLTQMEENLIYTDGYTRHLQNNMYREYNERNVLAQRSATMSNRNRVVSNVMANREERDTEREEYYSPSAILAEDTTQKETPDENLTETEKYDPT